MFKKLLILSIVLCAPQVLSMEPVAPKPAKTSPLDQLVALYMQNEAPIENPLVIEAGFGQTFDYASLLNPTNNVSQKTYERRLRAFKRYLFDYIDGKSCTKAEGKSHREIQSGSVINFLRTYTRLLVPYNKASTFIPRLMDGSGHEHWVMDCIPHSVFKKNGGLCFQLAENILIGHAGFAQIEGEKKRINLLDIPALKTLNLEAKKRKKRIEFSHSKPLFILTEPDAESICFMLGNPAFDKKSVSQKIQKIVDLFRLPDLGDQARRILNCYAFDLLKRKSYSLIEDQKKRKKETPSEEDKRPFDMCCIKCPHILKLQGFENYLLNVRKMDDLTNWAKNATDLAGYSAALDQLSAEYTTLYNRIQKELKELTAKKKSVETSDAEPEQSGSDEELGVQEPEPEEPVIDTAVIEAYLPIKYDDRICRWYRAAFANTQNKESIFYHTALPRIADDIVRKYGKRTPYRNKTNKGQIDDLYTIRGKIKNNETAEESFYTFSICVDPNGICYHRGCTECTWEELQEDQTVDFQEEKASSEINGPEISQEDRILIDTFTHAVISNSMHKCTITLYKTL